MPAFWQIPETRGHQTHGVWKLVPGFQVGGTDLAAHEEAMKDLREAAALVEERRNALDSRIGELAGEFEFFKMMNVAVAARLASEVGDEEGLRRDIGLLGIKQSSRVKIEERALKTCAAWEKVDAFLAAQVPAQAAAVVRGLTAGGYRARWEGLPDLRNAREVAAGDLRTAMGDLRGAEAVLDGMNKRWYQAWKSEYPPGTPEGDALAGVDAEKGRRLPQVLEISAVAQEGLWLVVSYVPKTGRHATVRDLIYGVEGEDLLRVGAEVKGGNRIGPFEEGQEVRLWTEVGNGRVKGRRGEERVVIAV